MVSPSVTAYAVPPPSSEGRQLINSNTCLRITRRQVSFVMGLPPVSGIELGEAALAGFTEAVVQIDARLVHGTADHIVADIPGSGEEIA